MTKKMMMMMMMMIKENVVQQSGRGLGRLGTAFTAPVPGEDSPYKSSSSSSLGQSRPSGGKA